MPGIYPCGCVSGFLFSVPYVSISGRVLVVKAQYT